MLRRLALFLLTLSALTACGAAAPSAALPTGGPAAATVAPQSTAQPVVATTLPAVTAAPSAPTSAPAPTEETSMSPTASGEAAGGSAAAMTELAKQDLVTRASVEASKITIISTQETEWNNSSLGCPKPDMAYMQVITPGYLIMLEADGKTYEYHADRQRTVILCEQPALKSGKAKSETLNSEL